ncbi:hypothetical protein [Candidatus Ichthyocystis hellenicum]|uniref:hypothetical protein n=1 Tax=Candidatus Ichthyocystis hellenicum TaxID=1561003 RepID=UPI000B87CBB2|nr:hypothetical protein [Candidatus Ichthyocystis hellenicum]
MNGLQDCVYQTVRDYNHDVSGSDCSFVQCPSTQSILSVDGDLEIFVDGNSDASLSYQLVRDLCSNHGVDTSIETVAEVFKDDFFQLHAAKFGYTFTEDFLSIVNKSKIDFAEMVDSILPRLHGSFSFLGQLGGGKKTLMELMNKICSSFSNSSYKLRDECCDVLESSFIPSIINTISSYHITTGIVERKMTYCEKEKFFIHYVTTLERIIMAKIMGYWNEFCGKNKLIFSSLPSVSYIDPFYSSRFVYGFSHHEATCPVAFSNMFGACISRMAAADIDRMGYDIIGTYLCMIKNTVRSKCVIVHDKSVSDYNFDFINEIKIIRKYFINLIGKEFDKIIDKNLVRGKFGGFLKKLLIWNRYDIGSEAIERSRSFLLEKVIDRVCELLRSSAIDVTCALTRDFRNRITKFRSMLSSRVRRSIRTTEDRWGVYLHPECSYGILSIRRKFSAIAKVIIKSKFCAMMKGGYKFSNGTSISSNFNWSMVAKDVFPIIQEEIRSVIFEEREALSELLSKARIVVDSDKFDGSYLGTREATSEERINVLLLATNNMNNQIRALIRSMWAEVAKTSKKSDLSHIFLTSSKNKTPNTDTISDRCEQSIISSKLSYSSLVFDMSRIFDKWGLNIHPDDVKVILFVRAKFSVRIKRRIREFFSCMLRDKYKLKNGEVLEKCKWGSVSRELYPIMLEAIDPIIKEEYLELDEVFSKSRVVVIGKEDVSSCVIRDITKDEKDGIVERAMVLIHKELRHSVRSLWEDVDETSGLDFEEKIKDAKSKRHSYSGIELRFEDNIDIMKVRRRFSFNIRWIISNKFRELTKVNRSPWRHASKDVFPIIKKDVNHLIEKEREELNLVLLKSRVVTDDCAYDSSSGNMEMNRELTAEERSMVLGVVMEGVHKQLVNVAGILWRSMIKRYEASSSESRASFVSDDVTFSVTDVFPVDCGEISLSSVGLSDLSEVDVEALDNIRLEFVGSLASVIDETINKVLLEVGANLSGADYIIDRVVTVVSEKSFFLFKNGGFFNRLDSLLSNVLVRLDRNDRFLVDEEKERISQMFMDTIHNDRDNLIKNRATKLIGYSRSSIG